MSKILWIPINIVQLVLIWVWTTLGVVAAMIVLIMARRPHPALWMAHRPWAPVTLAILGARLNVRVEGDIDWSATHVYISNHQSMADIPALFAALRIPIRFIAKKELFSLPVVGWYLRSTGMIPIDRGNRKQAARDLAMLKDRDLRGSSILAFAEGTRSYDGSIGEFKRGAFILALQSGIPIVPVAIEGTRHVVVRSGLAGRPSAVTVRVGMPIETAGLTLDDRHELVKRVRDEVVRLHEMGSSDPSPAPSEARRALG